MTLVFAIIADEAGLGENGKLNITGIFNQVFTAGFPASIPSMCLILRFEVPSVEFGREKQLRIPLVGPDGKEVVAIDATMVITINDPNQPTPPKAQHDQIIRLENLVLPEPGDYAFHIMVGGEEKATVPLIISRQPS